MAKRALFLDRDGVINEDLGYVHEKKNFIFVDGIFDLVRMANNAGWLVIVITNQSGIGRGLFSEDDFLALNEWMKLVFVACSCRIDAVYYCPDHPVYGLGIYRRHTDMRKPGPGMFFLAAKEHDIDLASSVVIGDSTRDIVAGATAGVGTLLYFGRGECREATATINCLHAAVPWIA